MNVHAARRLAVGGRRARALVALAIVGVAVGGVAVVRSSLRREEDTVTQRTAAREIERAVRDGQIALKGLAMSPLPPSSSLDEIRSRLLEANAAGREGGAASRDAVAERKLVGHAAEFIYYRFVQESAEAYRAWREAGGYRMKDAAGLRRDGVAKDYEYWFEEAYPGDDRLREAFDRLWVRTLAAKDDRSRPVGIAQDAAGVEVAIGVVDRAWERPMPSLSGELSEGVWQEARSGQLGRDWWEDPNGGIRGELRRRTGVPVAVVGVIVEMKAGDRYPFTFTYYRDAAGKWWLWRVNVLNSPLDRFVQIEI